MQFPTWRRSLILGVLLAGALALCTSNVHAQSEVFSQDGKLLATVGKDARVRLWELATAKQLPFDLDEKTPVDLIMLSNNGKILATRTRQTSTIDLWSTESGKQLPGIKISNLPLGGFLIAPDNQSFVVIGADGTVVLCPEAVAATLPVKLKASFSEKPGDVFRLTKAAYAPDGALLATGGWDGTVKLFDAHTGKELAVLLRGQPERAEFAAAIWTPNVRFSPDGKWLVAKNLPGSRPGAQLKVWDVANRKEAMTDLPTLFKSVDHMTFSPDSKTMAFIVDGSRGRWIMVQDMNNGKRNVIGESLGKTVIFDMQFSPNGKSLAVASSPAEKNEVKVYALAPKKLQATFAGNFRRFGADSDTVITFDAKLQTNIWSISDGKVRRVIDKMGVISPDGRTVLVGVDGRLQVWDTTTGAMRSELKP